MADSNKITLLDTRCWANVLEGIKFTFKSWVREAVEDVISEQMCNANPEKNKLLTAEELCSRWEICKSTLYNYEVEGKIAPVKVGRKKLYPIANVIEYELENCKKPAC